MTTTQRPIAKSTQEKALKTLDGMTEIVEAEMLVHGTYLEGTVSRPERYGTAICNGQRACALGTMYVAYGVKGKETLEMAQTSGTFEVRWNLPGTSWEGRNQFVNRRPGLGLVYHTLKRLSQEYAKDHGWGPGDGWNAEERQDWHDTFDIESLFEDYMNMKGGEVSQATRQVMLDLIAAARKEIEGSPVAS